LFHRIVQENMMVHDEGMHARCSSAARI
jgi:hypothetical protein